MMLGGGRERKEDSVDAAVGLSLAKKIGDVVRIGDTLCTVYYNSDLHLNNAAALLARSFGIGPHKLAAPPLVQKIIGAGETAD